MFKNTLALVVVAIFTTGHLHAQESKHQIRFTGMVSPSFFSTYTVSRDDYGQEKYAKDTGVGLGAGYGYELFPFMSLETGIEYFYLNGSETDANYRIPYSTFYLSIGPGFHLIRNNPDVDINLGYVRGVGFIKYPRGNSSFRDNGLSEGLYLGLSSLFHLSEKRAIKISIQANGHVSLFDETGSGDIYNITGLSTRLKISYVLRF